MITLKTLKDATAQEVFDQVANHMLSQNAKSLADSADPEGGCAYRGEEGRKCAAGCLMADDEYIRSWEGISWGAIVDRNITRGLYSGSKRHVDLIDDLQTIHDSYIVEKWFNELWRLARNKELDTKVLEKYEQAAN